MKRHISSESITMPPSAAALDDSAARCSGLIPATIAGSSVLTAAPALQRFAAEPMRPLAIWHNPAVTDSSSVLYAWTSSSDMSLWVSDDFSEPYEIEHPAVDQIYCAVANADGFTAMTSSGPLSVVPSPEGWICPQAGASPLQIPELLTLDAGSLTARISPRTFTSVVVGRDSLTVPDAQIRSLHADLCSAYSLIAEAASAGSLWLQPVVARVMLRDAEANLIIAGCPAVARTLPQCCELLSAKCSRPASDSVEVPAMVLSAQAYRLKIRITRTCADALNASAVRSAEVWVSPQLHTVDTAADMPLRWTAVSTSSPALTVAVPGATSHFASIVGSYARHLRAIISNSTPAMHRRLVLTAPFAPGDYTVEVPRYDSVTSERAAALRLAALADSSAPALRPSALLGAISAPASFAARTGCVCGNNVVWADITPVDPLSFDLANICLYDHSHTGPWTATVRVTLRSARPLFFHIAGSGASPCAWAPSVGYPHPDAVAMDIYVASGAEVLHGRADLFIAADGSCAFRIDSLLQSQPFSPFSGTVPQPHASTAPAYPGAVVLSPLASPTTPLKAALCCPARIVTVTPARRSLSAWDSAATRAYAFSPAGIFAVNTGSASSGITAAMIDSRPITIGNTVAVTSTGVMACSGSRLLCLSGVTVKSSPIGSGVIAIAWDDSDGALWMLRTDGSIALYLPSSGTITEISAPPSVHCLTAHGGNILLASAHGLWRKALPDAPRPILWSHSATIPCGYRVERICIHAEASHFNGNITISASHSPLSFPDETSAVISAHGTLHSPIAARLAFPHRPCVSVEISGSASPDFCFRGINLYLSKL